MNDVIFNKYSPQHFDLKLSDIADAFKEFDPIRKA